jgi:hypothetical protein
MGGTEQHILTATYVLFLLQDVLCPVHGEGIIQNRFSSCLFILLVLVASQSIGVWRLSAFMVTSLHAKA